MCSVGRSVEASFLVPGVPRDRQALRYGRLVVEPTDEGVAVSLGAGDRNARTLQCAEASPVTAQRGWRTADDNATTEPSEMYGDRSPGRVVAVAAVTRGGMRWCGSDQTTACGGYRHGHHLQRCCGCAPASARHRKGRGGGRRGGRLGRTSRSTGRGGAGRGWPQRGGGAGRRAGGRRRARGGAAGGGAR